MASVVTYRETNAGLQVGGENVHVDEIRSSRNKNRFPTAGPGPGPEGPETARVL